MVYIRGAMGQSQGPSRYRTAPAYKKSPSKQKRWYVDASLPSKLPFLGGAGVRFGSGTQPLTKRSVQSIVRNTLLENKEKIVIGLQQEIKHSTIYTWNPFSNISIGTGDTQRIGDCIHIKSVKINGLFSDYGRAAANNATSCFRFMWVKHIAQYGSGVDTMVSGLGTTEIFKNGTSVLAYANADSDKCTVLMDKSINISPKVISAAATGLAQFQNISLDLPMPPNGITLQFNTPTGNYAKSYNYYLLVFAEQVFTGTSGVTTCGYLNFDSVVNFVDSK